MTNWEKKYSYIRKRPKPKQMRKKILREVAIEQINNLLTKADYLLKTDFKLAQKYVEQARKIQMRTRVSLPDYWKKRICRHCKTLLKPGVNCKVRLSSTNRVVSIKCNICGQYNRFPYYKHKKR
ncbi:MAG: ribonuclease P protein component 4 [Candidatus Heimdallarchaeaceae archaeon]